MLKEFAILVGLCVVAGLVFGLGSRWFPWMSGGGVIAVALIIYFQSRRERQ